MKIWDPLSAKLLSTLTKPGAQLTGKLAYSPDGHSLASISNTSLIVWDIQTRGVAKEIEYSGTKNVSLIWSLDRRTIGAIFQDQDCCDPELYDQNTDINYTVCVYNIALGTILFPGTLQSRREPQLWAHNTSFQVMTVGWNDQGYTIEISEVGSILTKVTSFHIKSFHSNSQESPIRSFSPVTYQISILTLQNNIHILDIQNSECLLETEKNSGFDCFSSDGSLFAAYSFDGVYIWKHTSGYYTMWRRLPWRQSGLRNCSLQFSPTLSSLMGYPDGVLQVWHLDGPLITANPTGSTPLAVLSCCGTYMVACYARDSTITITNPLSQIPLQYIDTDMEIYRLALTGNILLVWDFDELVAWQLTEDGTVDHVFGGRRANTSDSIWSVCGTDYPGFSFEDQTVIIEDRGKIICTYHAKTGEILEPIQKLPHSIQYGITYIMYGEHYHHHHKLDDQDAFSEGSWPVSLQEG